MDDAWSSCDSAFCLLLRPGHRLANVYNLSSKQFLFKFNVPGEGKKLFLLMESGARAHTTEYEREKDKLPSNFCLKLRKHVRTKRLEKVMACMSWCWCASVPHSSCISTASAVLA